MTERTMLLFSLEKQKATGPSERMNTDKGFSGAWERNTISSFEGG